MTQPVLFSRRAQAMTLEALADTRVVVVNGARQVGKSTLASLIAGRVDDARQLYLDDPAILAAAEEDPVAFVRHDALLLIDEIQRAPQLLLPIKHEVDRDPRAGRYLLTGSARLLDLRDLPDALPGRTETIELWPLSQGEIDSAPDGFVDYVFTHGVDVSMRPCSLRKPDYVDRALRGGYPEAVRRDPGRRRNRFFDSYITDLITRDVRQISDIERPAEMRRLLSVIAARMGGLAVVQSIAGDVGLPRVTLSRYLDLLELVFVIKRIPAWSSNLTRRAISTPKLLVTDSGLGGRLIGMSPERARDVTAPIGPLLENFAIGEVARQLTWANEPVQLFHYRDRDKVEVDVVLEHASGEVIGIEIKAAETVRGDDFRGLRHLADRLGARFRAGFVLYTGEQVLPFGERLRALPMASLWTFGNTTEGE
ncbi:ATP-binding protein [Nonomuraea jabiensis]|uniref:Putative AAA+ superfamily ATPase n=1 Tax=Nonomuraea jabiensis TaxID=882448 RepID=A0A7W9G5Q5_9ACTN|nr:ATP-binding protein [Nonomuraea jabiensis]MBB5777710.1 putative AAA+ superfamily ATPase [Nonomuraea jabiensis]